MKQKLHKDLNSLLTFYRQQRQSPPETFVHKPGVVHKPSFFSVKALQEHLNNPLMSHEWLNMKLQGRELDLEQASRFKPVQGRKLQFLDKGLINQAISDGAAVVLEGIDILDSGVSAFVGKLEEALPCSLSNCVAFFSQQNNEAYAGHLDTDDVLVVQISGRKHWRIFEPQQRRYFDTNPLSERQMGKQIAELTMKPGDAIYLSAGVPHIVSTAADHSLHLAFDLIDRSPNIERITHEANQLYNQACAPAYGPVSNVVDNYINLLQDEEVRAKFEETTRTVAEEAKNFRECIGRASAIRALNKYS